MKDPFNLETPDNSVERLMVALELRSEEGFIKVYCVFHKY